MTAPPACFRCPIDLPADRLAPVIGAWPGPALLESGPGFGAAGRWSILAARPRRVFASEGRRLREESTPGPEALTGLEEILRRHDLAGPGAPTDPDLPPFQGGLIGYLGYDVAPWIERLPRKPRPDLPGSLAAHEPRMPAARFALYDTFVTVDHATGAAELWAYDLLGEGARRDPSPPGRMAGRPGSTRTGSPAPGPEIRAPKATSPARLTWRPSGGRWITSPPGTSSRSTSRSGSPPGWGASIRWTSSSA